MDFSNKNEFWVVNWSTDSDGRCAYIDPQWRQITGQTAERAIAEGWLEAIHQDDQEQARTELELARRSERSFQIVARLAQADGQFRWAMAVAAPRYDAQGAYIGHCGSILDFHDRITAQRELGEIRQRLEAVMNAAPVGLSYSTDPSCAFITGNRETFTQFEIDASDNASASAPEPSAAGRKIRYRKDGRELTESELPLQVASREGRPVEPIEMEVELPSGRRWRMEASGAPILSPGGQVLGAVAVTVDVTERKARLDELRSSEQRFRTLFETSRDGIVTVDLSGRILDANPAYQEMLGYTLEELKRLTYQELTPEIWHEMEAAIVREHILPRGESAEYEKEYVRKDGRVFPISLRTWTVADDQGRIFGMRAFVRDITERKEAEAALRDSEQRMRRFYDSGLLGVIYWNVDGEVTEANDKFLEMVGYTRADLQAGRINWLDMTPPELLHVDEAAIREVKATGFNASPFEKQFFHKNGSRVSVIVAGAMLDEARLNGVAFVLDITRRKQAEAALRASERGFRAIFNQQYQYSALLSADGRVIEISESVVRGTGVPREEIAGRPLLDAAWWRNFPDVRARLQAQFDEARARPGPSCGEGAYETRDGAQRYALNTVTALRDERGEIEFLLVEGIDITERKQAELALRESRQQLELALEAGQLGFWDWDIPSGRVQFGGRWAAMLGYDPDEIEPHVRSWERLIHPDEREAVSATLLQHLEGRVDFYECEHRLRHKDGSWRWILDRGRVVERDGEGRPLRAIGTHADVTARHEAEAALRDSEERFRMSFANASIGFAMNGPDYQFLDANPAYCALTGYSLEELRAQKGSELIHPDDWPSNEALVKRMTAGEIPGFVIENRYVRKTGEHIWVRKSVSLIRHADGGPRWLITLVEDVTERKQAEEALQQSRNDLDRAQEVGKIGWWRLDVRENVLTWSDENYRIFGVPKGTPLSYDKFLSMVHPDDRAYVDAQWQSALRGEPYDIEHRLMSGGAVKWVREKAYLEFDATGALLGGFGITQDLTDRKLVEQKLAESELRYRTLVEAASAVAWRCPPSGLQVEPQPEWMAFTGQTAEEMLGDGWSKAIHPDDLAQAASKWRDAVARGVLFENEHRIRRHDGQWRWMSVQVAPVHDGKGEIVEWFGMNIDITERKAAEERLRASEETLLNAQRCARAGVWDIDLVDDRVVWSEPYYELFGLPQSMRPSYENWIATIHPDDRPRVEAEYARSLEARDAQQIEFRIIRNGRVRWMHREGRVICDDAGRPLRVAGITWDITERKRAEDALLWHMRRSDLLSETAAQLLASEDPQRLADELCNKVMTFLDCDLFFNYLLDEDDCRLRLNACAGVPGEGTPSLERLDLGAAVCGCVASHRERIIAEDIQNRSDPRTELVKSLGIQAYCCHPLLHQDRVIGTLSFGARSRAHFSDDEIAVMKAVTDLVAIAMRRGETEQALREADRRKDEFLATLAHELRNPLAPIQNALHILRKKHGPEYPDARLLDMMQRQVGHLIRLVEDLLEVSRISRGKIELRKENVDLQTILSDALESCQPLIDKKSHHVLADVPDEPIWLFGDPVRLTQIVANIVNNAAKYTPPGGRIEVEAVREGDQIALRVRDNGVGISADMMPRVFDLFAQTDGHIRLSEGGLGIGLALVRSLVELHGGRVHASSAGVGRGSEFVVTLPLADLGVAK
jgi:PAS domain S-box-containing protein